MPRSSDILLMDEPRCPTCGYSLHGLTEFRCPECGTPFDREYIEDIDQRRHLLHWERPEAGGRVRRLRRTVLQASLHPGRYFSALSQRKDRSVENAGSFILACIIVAIGLYVASEILGRFVFFVRLTLKHGEPMLALKSVASIIRITISSAWYLPSLLILSRLLSVFVVAVLFARVYRSRIGVLSSMDLAAVFSPTIVFGAVIAVFFQVVLAVSQYSLIELMIEVSVTGQSIVLLLLVWHYSRKLLELNRVYTTAIVIVSGIVQYGCEMLASYVHSQISLIQFL